MLCVLRLVISRACEYHSGELAGTEGVVPMTLFVSVFEWTVPAIQHAIAHPGDDIAKRRVAAKVATDRSRVCNRIEHSTSVTVHAFGYEAPNDKLVLVRITVEQRL